MEHRNNVNFPLFIQLSKVQDMFIKDRLDFEHPKNAQFDIYIYIYIYIYLYIYIYNVYVFIYEYDFNVHLRKLRSDFHVISFKSFLKCLGFSFWLPDFLASQNSNYNWKYVKLLYIIHVSYLRLHQRQTSSFHFLLALFHFLK